LCVVSYVANKNKKQLKNREGKITTYQGRGRTVRKNALRYSLSTTVLLVLSTLLERKRKRKRELSSEVKRLFLSALLSVELPADGKGRRRSKNLEIGGCSLYGERERMERLRLRVDSGTTLTRRAVAKKRVLN